MNFCVVCRTLVDYGDIGVHCDGAWICTGCALKVYNAYDHFLAVMEEEVLHITEKIKYTPEGENNV